ncbi:MAG: hypothetical protein JXA22_08080 [Candidatus Thermoplasmatota archaeon]|nr:hypothetical protein [Candidatus Thermoplasmatota archaeon]
MSGRITTVSARFSPDQVEMLDRIQSELNISKTDVLHLALENLEKIGLMPRVKRVEVLISADSMKRAARLHEYYQYGTSLDALLSEALELGIREIRTKLMADRKEDTELARVDMDARSIEMQQDSMTR